MPPSRRIVGLVVLALVALGLRAGLVWAVSGEQGAAANYAYEHGEIAENLLAGRGFTVKYLGVTGPTSQQAPFYPYLLAGAYKLFGSGTPEAILAVRSLQCLATGALVLVVVWLAWSLVPERPLLGWIAGWGAAVYPTHVYMVTNVQVALWAALVLTLAVAIVASPRGRQSWSKAALAGLVCGLLLLIEPILAIGLPLVALMFLRADLQASSEAGEPGLFMVRREFGALGRVATMAAVAALVIAPWLWRNYRVHGEMVFIKSTFGYAFWQANNPVSRGTDKIPQCSAETARLAHGDSLAGMHRAVNEARLETTYIDDLLLWPGGYREFQGLSEPARSRLLSARAWEFVRNEPGRYLRLCLARLRYFLLFDETNPKAANLVYRVSTVVWLALTAAGLFALRRQWRRLWPALAIVGVVTAFHSLTIVSARFRIPLEPLTFVWAAAGVATIVERLNRRMRLALLIPFTLWPGFARADDAPLVVVANSAKGFALDEAAGPQFVPWGFNYDHDEQGRLLEDYWFGEWEKVERDFRTMKQLGANVVRVHLQVARFLDGPDTLKVQSLDRLAKLLRLAEEVGLYLDLTGLGCYHKADVPAWYDKLSERDRWSAQAQFWRGIAERCADSPAVFCYDLMNEPVAPGGRRKDGDWLGPAFAGKHFVQVISLDQQDRPRHEIARAWIRRLTAAIREHDTRHLITVGLVDWSLDRPGLTSGFVPRQLVDEVDFVSVHLYPKTGKLDDALDTLEGFAVGKPVLIEETFPLACSPQELGEFIDASRKYASGWIGFYWGKPPDELRRSTTLADALTLGWLELFQRKAKAPK